MEEEEEHGIALPLFSIRSTMVSADRAWMTSSPVHTTASVPFNWEEEPGKPKIQCKSMSNTGIDESVFKRLELPPRLLYGAKNSELISPISVLDDESYVLGRLKFQSSSFRMAREWNTAKEISKTSCDFPSSVYRENEISEDHGEIKERVNVKAAKFRRSQSVPLPKLKAHFLTKIYENLKQVVPWRRRKSRKIYGNKSPNLSPLL